MEKLTNKSLEAVERERERERVSLARREKEKGITIVALIITIIVLIIFAVVTIFAFTESGLFRTASKGAENYAGEQKREKEIMNNLEEYSGKIVANLAEIEAGITDGKIFVESVTITPKQVIVKEGETTTLTVSILPENAENKTLTWKSSDETKVKVLENADGTVIVTGVAETTENIIVTATTTDGSNNGNETLGTCIVTVTPLSVADIINQVQKTPKTVKDENGNKVVIPDGFRILPHGEESADIAKVEYNYNSTTHAPCVQDGIVVADDEGNQFVWVPVGEITNKDKSKTTITLGRYSFVKGQEIPETPVQSQTNYEETVNIKGYGSVNFQESIEQTGSISHAKDLKKFIENSIEDGGYYLARYEASGNTTVGAKFKYDKDIWISVTQANASNYAQKMKNTGTYQSDLINSYSWDTAIIFIEKYGVSGYSNKIGEDSTPMKSGKVGDSVLNINDMASNYPEYSTEWAVRSDSYVRTSRGAYYIRNGRDKNVSVSDRVYCSGGEGQYTFRSVIFRANSNMQEE